LLTKYLITILIWLVLSSCGKGELNHTIPKLNIHINEDLENISTIKYNDLDSIIDKDVIVASYRLTNLTDKPFHIHLEDTALHSVVQEFDEILRENKVQIQSSESWRRSDISSIKSECPQRDDKWQPINTLWNRIGFEWIKKEPEIKVHETIYVNSDIPTPPKSSEWQDFSTEDQEHALYLSQLNGQTLSYNFDYVINIDSIDQNTKLNQPSLIKNWQLSSIKNTTKCPDVTSIQRKIDYKYLSVEGYPRTNLELKTHTESFSTNKFKLINKNNEEIVAKNGWFRIPANQTISVMKYAHIPYLKLHNDTIASNISQIKDYNIHQRDNRIVWNISQGLSINTIFESEESLNNFNNISQQTFRGKQFKIINNINSQIAQPSIISSQTEADGSLEISIESEIENTIIYYTIDGNNPTQSSSLYSNPFTINQDTVVKAIAVKDTYISDISIEYFELNKKLLAFSFEDDAQEWTIVDDSTGESSWNVIDGELVQSNERGIVSQGLPIDASSSFDESYHLGSYAYLSSGFNLIDYHMSLDITPMSNPTWHLTDNGHDIGVMFRYIDTDNYYRLSLNSAYGFSRLEKKVNGIFTTLATDARGYENEDQVIKISIEISHDLMHIYVNDDARFSARDSELSSGTIALYTQDAAKFDNITINETRNFPSIIINSPLGYSVNTNNQFTVSAITKNLPEFGNIEFNIDNIPCLPINRITTGYYSATCPSVDTGNHTVIANVRDAKSNIVATDSNELVGSSGNIFIAIGDSITNGIGDKYKSDNQSFDGKVISSQGFTSILHDILNNSRLEPNLVINEGIPREKTSDVLHKRINSIFERHNNANYALIMLGTNDSGGSEPTPSGIGCINIECENTYKGNMQAIINLITPNITPIIALPPPVFYADSSINTHRNNIIRDYIQVIQSELTDMQIGPDFYNYFLNIEEDRRSLFIDSLHPNAMGQVIMAHLWGHNLNGNSNLPSRSELPLVLENICVKLSSNCLTPLTYKQNFLEADGTPYYIDETYSLTAIPKVLSNGIWLSTANDDQNNDRNDYLTFTVDRDVNVYIAYDPLSSSIPDWLVEFTDINQSIGVSDPNSPTLKLYHKSFIVGVDTLMDGSITLGGNQAAGSIDSNRNYIVIVKDKKS